MNRPSARRAILADGVVPAGREAVFAFIMDLEHHWRLADRWIEVIELDRDGLGGRVRMHGPLGLRRTAATRVSSTRPPGRLEGTADLGSTRALVTWTLTEAGPHATRVRLEARVSRAGVLDRLLLVAGGRPWLRRRLAATVAALGAVFGSGGGAAQPGDRAGCAGPPGLTPPVANDRGAPSGVRPR